MRTAGIVSEFNIFHNGHKYLIDKVHEDHDAVVCIMSGSFVQRGDAAITDKWTRAEFALKNGADLILELPVIYSLNNAESFAAGAVKILGNTGVIDDICFGSVCGDAEKLTAVAEMIENEPEDVSEKIKGYLAEGFSYPASLEKAFTELKGSEILRDPDDMLGVEYIRAMMKMDRAGNRSRSRMQPCPIKRIGTRHDSTAANGGYASASLIRNMLREGEDVSRFVPENVCGFDIYDIERISAAEIYKLRTIYPETLSMINGISEGFENRLIRASYAGDTLEKLCLEAKTKRYTLARIRRSVIASLLDLTAALCRREPSYIRVLGMNETGMKILAEMRSSAELPVITKTADYTVGDPIFQAELRATAAFALCGGGDLNGKSDYTKSPIIIK